MFTQQSGIIRNNNIDNFPSYIDCPSQEGIYIPNYGYITSNKKNDFSKYKFIRNIIFRKDNKMTFKCIYNDNNIFEVIDIISIDTNNKILNYIISKIIKRANNV